MRIGEFIEAVESYGVVVPAGVATKHVNQFYERLLDLPRTGTGTSRRYTSRHIRRLVAWVLLARVAGAGDYREPHTQNDQRRHAMRLLAAAPEGWVVMADGRAWWSLVAPVATFRSTCAVAIPVPEWRH